MKKILIIVLSLLSLAANAQVFVTNGKITQLSVAWYDITSSSSRADIDHNGNSMELVVKYLGPTVEQSLFADGTYQQQIGMKLRNQDGCNLVYVMRRLTPNPSIIVSVKSNPGVSTTCGDKGYTMIKSIPVPAPTVNSTFVLGASFENDKMTLRLDGRILWIGDVPSVNKGNAGIRTDNTRIQFSVR
jgi:hypothetical protein